MNSVYDATLCMSICTIFDGNAEQHNGRNLKLPDFTTLKKSAAQTAPSMVDNAAGRQLQADKTPFPILSTLPNGGATPQNSLDTQLVCVPCPSNCCDFR
jgi:hypothetical protein